MSSLYLILAAVIPSAICLLFLMMKSKKVGVLQEQKKALEAKNSFLSNQLEKEMELSDKRTKQITSLLNTGKFNFIELPQDPTSNDTNSSSDVQGTSK